MKNLLNLFALVAVVTLASCGGGVKNTPEDVSTAFAKALSAMDYSKAKSLGTDATKEALQAIEKVSAMMPAEAKAAMSKAKFEKATCADGEGGKKTCKVCCDEKGSEMPVTVIQKDGKWLVDMNKNEMSNKSGAGEESTPEEPINEEPGTEETKTETK